MLAEILAECISKKQYEHKVFTMLGPIVVSVTRVEIDLHLETQLILYVKKKIILSVHHVVVQNLEPDKSSP